MIYWRRGAVKRIEAGPAEAFAMAIDELASLFGANIRRHLRPRSCSSWSESDWIGGAYSHALPGHSAARAELARPFEDLIFFVGEAIHAFDFSTAHSAFESGQLVATEVIRLGSRAVEIEFHLDHLMYGWAG